MRISSLSKKTFWWSEVFGRSGKNAPGQTFRLIFLSQYLSCSLISISPFSCTQTIFLSFSLSLPPSLASTLSISYTHNLTLWLIHTIFLSISYTLYLTLCLIHTLSYSLSHTHCLYLYIIHNLSYTLSHTHSILHSGSYTLSFSQYHTHTILLSLSSPHLQYIARSLSLSLANTLSLSRSLSDISLYHTPTLTHYLSFSLSLCLSCIPSLFFKHKISSLISQSLTFTSENLYPMLSISLSKTLFLFLGLSLTFNQAHSLINPLLLTL